MSKMLIVNEVGGRLNLQINRPESLNSLNSQLLTEINGVLKEIETRSDIGVVVVSGVGDRAFVAGADIKEMLSFSPEQAFAFSKLGAQVFSKLESLPQIVIAQVQGFALGGGLELAMACDFLVASEKAKFGLPEVSLGLIPGFGGTLRLARRIGAAKALQWISTADKFNAHEALNAGLINAMLPPSELENHVNELAGRILRNGPQAVRVAKRVLRAGLDAPHAVGSDLESSQFGLLFNTRETTEGLAAFVEKRPPSCQSPKAEI
jgi:enoyl-CoA hydratase